MTAEMWAYSKEKNHLTASTCHTDHSVGHCKVQLTCLEFPVAQKVVINQAVGLCKLLLISGTTVVAWKHTLNYSQYNANSNSLKDISVIQLFQWEAPLCKLGHLSNTPAINSSHFPWKSQNRMTIWKQERHFSLMFKEKREGKMSFDWPLDMLL